MFPTRFRRVSKDAFQHFRRTSRMKHPFLENDSRQEKDAFATRFRRVWGLEGSRMEVGRGRRRDSGFYANSESSQLRFQCLCVNSRTSQLGVLQLGSISGNRGFDYRFLCIQGLRNLMITVQAVCFPTSHLSLTSDFGLGMWIEGLQNRVEHVG